jgi:glycosyltransferase involved in cell wall biosynthesis
VKLLFLTQVVDGKDAVLGFVPRWIEGLARECERVRAVALESGDTDALPANVDVRVVGRKGAISRWLKYRTILSEALEKDGFDTVLAHMVPRYALLARRPARRAGARLFLWYTHASVDGRLRRAVRAVEKVFTASPESLRVDTEKRVVTGHGIDLEHFSDGAEGDTEPSSPTRILSVGRMTPRKDPLTAIESTAILVARGHDLQLDLVGGEMTESDRGYLRTVEDEIRLGALEGRVQRAGSVPYREIPAYYRRACVVVNASLTGSLDKVVLEAMAMGRPVVTCNEAALPLFAELGDAAEMLAFEPGNAGQLADRIEALLGLTQAERDAIGGRLRAIAARDHEVDALMRRLVHEMGVAATTA